MKAFMVIINYSLLPVLSRAIYSLNYALIEWQHTAPLCSGDGLFLSDILMLSYIPRGCISLQVTIILYSFKDPALILFRANCLLSFIYWNKIGGTFGETVLHSICYFWKLQIKKINILLYFIRYVLYNINNMVTHFNFCSISI